jgi:saccharopine dehydrogenase-like NADP-dependent oxidoreductase
MTKKILLFGAGKSSACLIEYLVKTCGINGWFLTVADNNLGPARTKTSNSLVATATTANVENEMERTVLVKKANIVISLLPPALHGPVAQTCLEFGKPLLTASYLDERIAMMDASLKARGILFLCEMGLDPGIDHMSAMKLIHRIEKDGGRVISFKSHCGGLVSPASDDNPWHYKISWNPRNVVLAGNQGAVFKENEQVKTLVYKELFSHNPEVFVKGAGSLAYYPNRNSLTYLDLYNLQHCRTFIRTTLRHPAFCRAWNALVQSGLTSDRDLIDTRGLTYKKWSVPVEPFINSENAEQLQFLGLFDDSAIPAEAVSSADILQFLLETRLPMKEHDRDMIVMLHEVEYEKNGIKEKIESSLIIQGENSLHTAMAKTVGLPLGIAAELILKGKIKLGGVYIPVIPEIYEPVLSGLENHGIVFKETRSPL